MKVSVLHSTATYLRNTENWVFRLTKYQLHTLRYVASPRFLRCTFYASDIEYLRSPLQPDLVEGIQPNFFRKIARLISRVTYPWYLRWALRKRHIDILHSHFAPVGWEFQKVAERLGALHFVSFYGWDYVRLATVDPIWTQRLRQLFATADCFICEGPHGADLLANQGCARDKIRIAKLGVEIEKIPTFYRSKTPGRLRLVQIASFREKKGHLETVRAFAAALAACPNMDLTLFGASPGKIQDSIMAIVHTHGIESKVRLLPGLPFDQLHDRLREFQVFIHASRHAHDGDCEGGAPIVLLDAQATGMPIISTTHCDIPGEVIDGETGILCPEGDHLALVMAIEKFYNMDQEHYAAFSRAARAHVERNFDARACASHMERIYEGIVKMSGGKAH
jgi:colanic acid/amylovoran biosynthesis glycosyltransferase